MKFLVMNLPPHPILIPLGPNIGLMILFSNILSLQFIAVQPMTLLFCFILSVIVIIIIIIIITMMHYYFQIWCVFFSYNTICWWSSNHNKAWKLQGHQLIYSKICIDNQFIQLLRLHAIISWIRWHRTFLLNDRSNLQNLN